MKNLKNKFMVILTLVLLFLFSSCSSLTYDHGSKEADSESSNNTEVLERSTTESSAEKEEELLQYEYDTARTFHTKILELGKLMPDDSNAATYEAMETVTSNEYRKILQEKYNQGCYFSLEGRLDEPTIDENPPLTGNIIIYSADFTETQILKVGLENFDFVTARKKFEQENKRQLIQLQEELEKELKAQKQVTNINAYGDAVQILKEELGETDNTKYPHIFTNLGFVEASRSYYYIDVRQQGEEKSMSVGRVRVYEDNAEIAWE